MRVELAIEDSPNKLVGLLRVMPFEQSVPRLPMGTLSNNPCKPRTSDAAAWESANYFEHRTHRWSCCRAPRNARASCRCTSEIPTVPTKMAQRSSCMHEKTLELRSRRRRRRECEEDAARDDFIYLPSCCNKE